MRGKLRLKVETLSKLCHYLTFCHKTWELPAGLQKVWNGGNSVPGQMIFHRTKCQKIGQRIFSNYMIYDIMIVIYWTNCLIITIYIGKIVMLYWTHCPIIAIYWINCPMISERLAKNIKTHIFVKFRQNCSILAPSDNFDGKNTVPGQFFFFFIFWALPLLLALRFLVETLK